MPGLANVTVETEAPPEPQPAEAPAEPAAEQAQEPLLPAAPPAELEPRRVIEAALYLSNKPLPYAELALLAKCKVKEAGELCLALAQEFDERGSSLRVLNEAGSARLEVRPEFLSRVASLSRNLELSRKATRMLALIANKNGILQSELRKYFRGEIYAYVRELKDREYLTSEKRGNTRLLKPTKKFHENFQLAQG
jgi:chromosome segregation and condensation protein ScpB